MKRIKHCCLLLLLCTGMIVSLDACSARADIPSAEAAYVSWTGVSPFVQPEWSPDGTRLALEESNPMGDAHLALYALKDEQLTPLTYTLGYYTSISWAPDGSRLVVTNVNHKTNEIEVQIIDLNTKQIKTIGLGDGVAWAPDGKHIAVYVGPNLNTHQGEFVIKIVQSDGTLLKTIPLPITSTLPGPTPAPATLAPGQLFSIPPLPSKDVFGGMSWSPDSQQIVLSVIRMPSGGDFTGDLHVVNIAGNEYHKITSAGLNQEPAWSPDGKTIAYIKGSQLIYGRLYLIRPDGSCPSLLSEKITASSLSWSPDGSKIAYADGNSVYILDIKKNLASGTTAFSSCH